MWAVGRVPVTSLARRGGGGKRQWRRSSMPRAGVDAELEIVREARVHFQMESVAHACTSPVSHQVSPPRPFLQIGARRVGAGARQCGRGQSGGAGCTYVWPWSIPRVRVGWHWLTLNEICLNLKGSREGACRRTLASLDCDVQHRRACKTAAHFDNLAQHHGARQWARGCRPPRPASCACLRGSGSCGVCPVASHPALAPSLPAPQLAAVRPR